MQRAAAIVVVEPGARHRNAARADPPIPSRVFGVALRAQAIQDRLQRQCSRACNVVLVHDVEK